MSETVPSDMYAQRSFRVACTFHQSDQYLHWPLLKYPGMQSFFMRNRTALIKLSVCAECFESSLGHTCLKVSVLTITKTRLFKYIEIFTTKKGTSSVKKQSDIFHIPAQIIECGYSLEPPCQGGSNAYPQSF